MSSEMMDNESAPLMTLTALEIRRAAERAKYNYEYYEQHYWVEDLPGGAGNRGLSYDDPTHERRFAFLADLIARHFSPGPVLDAGCGMGGLLSALKGFAPMCAFDASFCGIALQRLSGFPRTCVAGLEAIPFRDDAFELVICTDVLEHLPPQDVTTAVGELVRVCRGALLLTINLDNPYEFHPSIFPRAEWVRLFNSTGLVREDNGLTVALQDECAANYPEYDVFVFTKCRPLGLEERLRFDKLDAVCGSNESAG